MIVSANHKPAEDYSVSTFGDFFSYLKSPDFA